MSRRHVKTVSAALAMTEKPIGDAQPRPTTDKLASLNAMVKVGDSLVNVAAGLGNDRDKKWYSDYQYSPPLTRIQLENIFRTSWAGKRIVKAVPEDMTREWVNYLWDGADDDLEGRKALKDAEQAFSIQSKVLDALTWAGLYGGGVIVMGIEGAETPEAMAEPLRPESIRRGGLRYLHVLDRWRLGASGELVRDLADPNFGSPEFYILAESGIRVHHSRLIVFHGQRLPYFLWRSNAMWHDSELQHIYENLRNYDTVTSSLATMMFEQNVDVIANDQMAEAMSMEGGETKIVARYAGMATMKSFNRLVLIDKDHEEYSRHPNTFTGMDKLTEKFMFDLCGAADIPATRLFGQAPAGLNATGESDMRNYYDRVKAKQAADMIPQLLKLMRVLVPSTLGRWPTDFRIEPNPLYQMSAVEKAQVEKTRAERDNVYLQAGVITEAVVAAGLKEDGIYPMMEDEDVEAVREMGQPMIPTEEEIAAGKAEAAKASKGIILTPMAQASIITVNEARSLQGLPAWPDADGNLTIAEFQAKHGGVIAKAVNVEEGNADGKKEAPPAPFGGGKSGKPFGKEQPGKGIAGIDSVWCCTTCGKTGIGDADAFFALEEADHAAGGCKGELVPIGAIRTSGDGLKPKHEQEGMPDSDAQALDCLDDVEFTQAAFDWNPDQPRDEQGRWAGEGGGSVGTTSSGKAIVAPERVQNFMGGGGGVSTTMGASKSIEHVERNSSGFSRKDHYEAHHALMSAAKVAMAKGDTDRAYHLGNVAMVHKLRAQSMGKVKS